MSILTAVNKIQYATPTGSTYSITFPFFSYTDIKAILTTPTGDINLALTTDFTLTAPGATGTLTKVGTWDTTATRLTIYRELALTQETVLANGDTLDAEVLDLIFDRITAMSQQIKEAIDRQITIPITDLSASMTLPGENDRASQFLAFDEDGNPIAAGVGSPVPASSWISSNLL